VDTVYLDSDISSQEHLAVDPTHSYMKSMHPHSSSISGYLPYNEEHLLLERLHMRIRQARVHNQFSRRVDRAREQQGMDGGTIGEIEQKGQTTPPDWQFIERVLERQQAGTVIYKDL
jgi:hypothetical protein